MNELFEKKNLPFYKFGDAIYLQKIGTTDWIDYIRRRFEVTGKQISKEELIRYFQGKHLVLINKDKTSMDDIADLVIHDSIGKVLSESVELYD